MIDNPKVGEKYYLVSYCGEYFIDLSEVIAKNNNDSFDFKVEDGTIWQDFRENLYETKDEAKINLISSFEKTIKYYQNKIKEIEIL